MKKLFAYIYIRAKGFLGQMAGPNWIFFQKLIFFFKILFSLIPRATSGTWASLSIKFEIADQYLYYFFVVLGGIFIYKCFPVIIFIKLWLQFILILLIAFIVNSLLLLLFLQTNIKENFPSCSSCFFKQTLKRMFPKIKEGSNVDFMKCYNIYICVYTSHIRAI